MTHRAALFASVCAVAGVLAGPAVAQVSTFTAGGGGSVALAPVAERPASRPYFAPVYVNVHQDASPGVADLLAPPASSDRAEPMRYGAAPALEDLRIAVNVGPTSVAFSPWTPIVGNGDLEQLEAARVDFLERYGLLGGVRTHRNVAAGVIADTRAQTDPEPRGVIRVRPAKPAAEPDKFVDAQR